MGAGFYYRKAVIVLSEAGWSYGGFNDFRKRLAKSIGIDLETMDGFGGDGKWEDIQDYIALFLNHSDFDKKIESEDCNKIAKRLREIVNDWPDNDYDKENALKLAETMDECHEFYTNLIFC